MPEAELQNRDVYESLCGYLDRALDILHSWSTWLAEHEQLVLSGQLEGLQHHALTVESLSAELNELSQSRAKLLAEARRAGFTCSTLKQLAHVLPQWYQDRSFRNRVLSVERSMMQLRRLNTAAWMLVHQCSRHVEDTLLLMTSGSTQTGSYIASPHADTTGGQILDQNI